jgi:predicted transcriptional regulator
MKIKIQSLKELEEEMRAVARGEKSAPSYAGHLSIQSTEALMRLLTADNRHLLKIIRDKKPQSVAELSKLTKRAEPNLLRTLTKLETFGLLRMKVIERRRVPFPTVSKLHVEIDPYAMKDRVEISRRPT